MKPPPLPFAVVAVGQLLAVTMFVIRLGQPIETEAFNMQLRVIPQYVAAFPVFVGASRAVAALAKVTPGLRRIL